MKDLTEMEYISFVTRNKDLFIQQAWLSKRIKSTWKNLKKIIIIKQKKNPISILFSDDVFISLNSSSSPQNKFVKFNSLEEAKSHTQSTTNLYEISYN